MQIAKLDVAIVSEGSNISIRICEPFYLFVYVCLLYIEYFVGLLFFLSKQQSLLKRMCLLPLSFSLVIKIRLMNFNKAPRKSHKNGTIIWIKRRLYLHWQIFYIRIRCGWLESDLATRAINPVYLVLSKT